MQSSLKTKIILDTDIGSDIDDTYALCYLLNEANVDLLGVCTVTGQAYDRALLCKILIEIANRDVPVYVGDEKPLSDQDILQPICHMKDIIDHFHISQSVEDEDASDYLVRMANEYPNEITLVGVAPFTNIAKAVLKDAAFASKIKRLVIMGGKTDHSDSLKKVLDWNMLCDVEAGRIILDANFNDLTIFPCELTNKVFTPSTFLHEHICGKYARAIKEMGENWFNRDHEVFHYHDPMACYYCVHPEIFKLRSGRMKMVNNDKGSYTIWIDDDNGKHHLAYDIDKDKFLNDLYQIIIN